MYIYLNFNIYFDLRAYNIEHKHLIDLKNSIRFFACNFFNLLELHHTK